MSVERANAWAGRLTAWLVYGLMLAAAVGAFWLIRAYGLTLTAPPPAERPAADEPAHVDVLSLLLALAAVVVAGQVLGRVFKYVGQPPVLGEVVGGILLGPTLLGGYSQYVLPDAVAPSLETVAQLGVVLYMFLVGLELNASLLRKKAHATVAISHASIVAPFVLGAALALWLYPRLSSSDVPFTHFALFMGVALSVTAFPVLARILTDRGLTRTDLGVVALTCAAADDVTAWCLLALLSGVVQNKLGGLGFTLLGTVAFIAFMFLAVRPALAWLTARYDRSRLSQGVVVLVFLGLLLSALATEAIGIHAVFGAFLFGAVIPHDGTVAREFTHRLKDLTTVVLLPAFFALTGMRTRLNFDLGDWAVCGVIVLAATAGKFGGSFAAARLTGLDARTSAALGLLMNTRGLMGLIVLHVGMKNGVISPALFSMMVVMALATTLTTAPLLHLLTPRPPPAGEGNAAPPAEAVGAAPDG
jgi:Kef-type K+ transport system membrane component KefB